MKATKQATPGTSGRSAPARGKFGKICLVLLLLATAVFCGFAPRAWAEPVGCWTDEGNYDISWYTDNPEAEEYDSWTPRTLRGSPISSTTTRNISIAPSQTTARSSACAPLSTCRPTTGSR